MAKDTENIFITNVQAVGFQYHPDVITPDDLYAGSIKHLVDQAPRSLPDVRLRCALPHAGKRTHASESRAAIMGSGGPWKQEIQRDSIIRPLGTCMPRACCSLYRHPRRKSLDRFTGPLQRGLSTRA